MEAFVQCLDLSVRRVLSELGPGLTECIYRNALAIELRKRVCVVSMEVPVPILFEGEVVGAMRADIVVTEVCAQTGARVSRVIELKRTAKITAAHGMQARAYLQRSPENSTAHLVNFGPEDVEIQTICDGNAESHKRALEETPSCKEL